MCMFSSVSSKPSHWPNVGEPRRRSTTTSKIAPRPQRTSLAAPRADLEVHAAHDAVARARVVVLDQLLRDAELREGAAAVGLDEEPALVAEDVRARAGSGRRGGCRVARMATYRTR